MEVPLWGRHSRSICRGTGLRDTKRNAGKKPDKNKKHRGTDKHKFPVEKRMNSEAAVHQKTSYTASDSFDSPVIYGVRVETSNPYHLVYIEHYGIIVLVPSKKVKKKFGHFQHFSIPEFV